MPTIAFARLDDMMLMIRRTPRPPSGHAADSITTRRGQQDIAEMPAARATISYRFTDARGRSTRYYDMMRRHHADAEPIPLEICRRGYFRRAASLPV